MLRFLNINKLLPMHYGKHRSFLKTDIINKKYYLYYIILLNSTFTQRVVVRL